MSDDVSESAERMRKHIEAVKRNPSTAAGSPYCMLNNVHESVDALTLAQHYIKHERLFEAAQEMLDCLRIIKQELAAITASPDDPKWMAALTAGNPADAECLGRAYWASENGLILATGSTSA